MAISMKATVLGFWVENFGEIEITYFPDPQVNKQTINTVKKKMVEQTDEIFRMVGENDI